MARKLKQKGGKGPAPTLEQFENDPNGMTAQEQYDAAYTEWQADNSMDVVEGEGEGEGAADAVPEGEGQGEPAADAAGAGEGETAAAPAGVVGGKRHKKKGGKKSNCSFGGKRHKKSAKKMGGKRGGKKSAKKMGGKRKSMKKY